MSKKAGAEQNNGNSLHVEWWPLGKVKTYSKNPRVRSKSLVEKIARSIEEFGWRQPIVVDESGIIVVGHGRYDAAVLRGWGEVPVHMATGWEVKQMAGPTARYGNADLFLKYAQICRELMQEKSSRAGYALEDWVCYHCGNNDDMTHFGAVLRRK